MPLPGATPGPIPSTLPSIDLAIGQGLAGAQRVLVNKVQGRVPIVQLRPRSQTDRHADRELPDMDMIGSIAFKRLSVPWIGARLPTQRRRWMRSHPAPTFVFVDLAGYTMLTDTAGDQAAARVASEFHRTMGGLCREHGAWQVKSMGDGVMIWAPDATRALALVAAALTQVGNRADLLPVRVGVHTGPAVMWAGIGTAVRSMSRRGSRARPAPTKRSSARRHELPPAAIFHARWRDVASFACAASSVRWWPGV